jgi:8-oxo-dGTP diphosphatase
MRIVVSAAIVEDHGRYFVTRRLKGAHLEGLWEFPGGKCEPGESLEDGLRRELKEELGADAVIGAEVFAVTHDYPDRSVELHFLSCTFLNAPVSRLGQEMRWVAREDLPSLAFPPADEELIRVLETATGR